MANELQAARSRHYDLSYVSNEQEFVTMRVGGQLFGISVMAVQDVLRRQRIAKVPLAPKVVAGLLNLRGRIATAIDMRVRLGMDPFENLSQAMNVVVEYRGDLYSMVVDSVGEVLSLPLDKFEHSPVNMSDSWRSVSAGVFKLDSNLLVILDVESIININ